MSFATTKPPATNLAPADMTMDTRIRGKDSRYYCLPPMHFDVEHPAPPPHRVGRYPFHLVSQGHRVGLFDTWAEAKASVSSFPEANHPGCHSVEEGIEIWQRLCLLGLHPHPVEPPTPAPPSPAASTFLNMSPRKAHR